MPDAKSPSVDTTRLAQALRLMARDIAASGGATRWVAAERDGRRIATLLAKRTYRIHRGRCELAAADAQLPICLVDVPYAQVDAPRVSPLIAVDESGALKPRTDVVVQAAAHTYSVRTSKTRAGFRIGDLRREVVVYGDRRGEVDPLGRYRFSEPERFEAMPIRWDRAYGGFDLARFRRSGRDYVAEVARVRPEWADALTPFHYPRNPCGRGYLTHLDAEGFENLAIPNLEHPWDPLTPARLATGGSKAWIKGPLPAAWDFVSLGWFPRSGYLGLTWPHDLGGEILAEVERGWAPPDILATPSLLHATSGSDVRREAAQTAAPGLSVVTAPAPGAEVELEALHPERPRFVFSLPRESMRARVDLGAGAPGDLPGRLLTLVIRVPSEEVEMTWGASLELPTEVSYATLQEAAHEARWVAQNGGGDG